MNVTNIPATTTSESLSRRLTRNAFFLLAGQVISTALALILNAILGRWLGAAGFGIYYFLVTVSTFVYVLVDWGQSAYLVREAVRRRADNGALLGGALVFRAGAGVAAALATAVLLEIIGRNSGTEALALLAVVCGLPIALSQSYGYMFRGQDRMDLDATVAVTGKALTAAATIPALLVGGGLTAVVSAQAVGGAGALVMAMFLAHKIHLKVRRPARTTLVELARGGAPIATFFVAVAVQPFIDVIVLSEMVPQEVVGWYGAARNILGVLFAPANILGAAWFPELSRASSSIQDLRRALRAPLRLFLGLGALAAAGTFLFADLAVGVIYGRGHFDPAVAVLQIFAPLIPLFFVNMLFGTAITAAGKTIAIAVVKALSVAVSTALALLLVPLCQARWGNGGIGLALAFGSSEVLMLAAYLRLIPRGVVDLSALPDFLRAATAAGGTVMISAVLPLMTPWLALPTTVAAFVALALASRLILKTDLHKIADLVPGKHERL
jgi:O-antigen/teichoic acid export membrane protein